MSGPDATPHERRRALPAARRRAGRARAGGARARGHGRAAVRARAPSRSRTPPARCCTPPTRSSRSTGRCPACSPSRPARCSRSRRGSRKPPTSRAPANPTDNEGRNQMREPAIGSYRDADGARHELVVRETADGGWHVLDLDVDGRHGARRRRARGRRGRPPAGRGDRPRLPDHRRRRRAGDGTGARRCHT